MSDQQQQQQLHFTLVLQYHLNLVEFTNNRVVAVREKQYVFKVWEKSGNCVKAGQKTSACPPVQDEYSLISDRWIYEFKSTCPMGRVEFAKKEKMFFSTEVQVSEHFGLCKLT